MAGEGEDQSLGQPHSCLTVMLSKRPPSYTAEHTPSNSSRLVGNHFGIFENITYFHCRKCEKREGMIPPARFFPDPRSCLSSFWTIASPSFMATAPLLAPYRAQQFSAKGEAVLRSHREATQNERSTSELVSNFTHLSYTFPLKLLTPRISSKDAIASARRERLRSPSSNNSTSSRSKYNSDPNAYVFTREEEAEQEERDRLAAAKLPTKVLQQHPDSNWSEKAIAALFIVGYGGGLVSGDCVSLSIDCGQKTALLLLTQGSTKVFKTRESFASKQDAQMRSHSLEGKVLPASTDQSSGPSTPFSTSTTSSPSPTTSQLFRCLVRRDSTLILLPDPVTCFSQAKYFQTQFFDLRDRKTSSLVLLDWITPGRTRSVGGDLSHGRGNVGFNRETMNREENEKEASKGIAKFGHLSGPELWQFESYRSRNVSNR